MHWSLDVRKQLTSIAVVAFSEQLLDKSFRAGQMIIADVEPDPDKPGDNRIVFNSVEGFEPPVLEEAAAEF